MAEQTTSSRLDSSFREAFNNNEAEQSSNGRTTPPPFLTESHLSDPPLLISQTSPSVGQSPSPDGLSLTEGLELGEFVRQGREYVEMAQITKDGLDRLFLELKSK